jgi:hypothetical protein
VDGLENAEGGWSAKKCTVELSKSKLSKTIWQMAKNDMRDTKKSKGRKRKEKGGGKAGVR